MTNPEQQPWLTWRPCSRTGQASFWSSRWLDEPTCDSAWWRLLKVNTGTRVEVSSFRCIVSLCFLVKKTTLHNAWNSFGSNSNDLRNPQQSSFQAFHWCLVDKYCREDPDRLSQTNQPLQLRKAQNHKRVLMHNSEIFTINKHDWWWSTCEQLYHLLPLMLKHMMVLPLRQYDRSWYHRWVAWLHAVFNERKSGGRTGWAVARRLSSFTHTSKAYTYIYIYINTYIYT